MKRRQAIRHIAIATAAAYMLPGCQHEPSYTGSTHADFPPGSEQYKFLEHFTEALLPKAKTAVKTPDSTTDFLLAVLNDCTPPADVQKYLTGMDALQKRIKERYKTDFGALPPSQQAEIFAWLAGTDGLAEPLKFFYEKTRGLTIEHFTSSEFFLINVAKWEFVPGRFLGCAAV